MADRSISNKELELIKNYKIKIHARSIFYRNVNKNLMNYQKILQV